MTFRVVRTNQYNQDLGLIHSTNDNHLESPKEAFGSHKEGRDDNVSTVAQGEHEKSIDGGPEGHIGTTYEIEDWVDNVELIEQEKSSNQIEKETATNEGDIVMRSGSDQPAQESLTYTIKGTLPAVIQNIWEKAECQLRIFDQWYRFRSSYILNKISSLKFLSEFSKAENKLLPWAETDRVNELLQRRDLIWYMLVELHLHKFVAEHWKEFNKAKPLANQDIMAIRMLEAELAKTRKNINLFQARAGLPVTYNERSADRVGSSDLTPCLTWEEFKA
ncbi:ABC transporter G family member 28-like [Dorcoceras hygrometricum]|uniref:ABC transporter G family member 28-like n=1 Tax=Dorcoceras hygrometricum TaxID=472368 RepID=A0A2Z7A1T0_9LAMI|nr:ABC transporter G family member 28-like [Dorcoceras hygrometricum]